MKNPPFILYCLLAAILFFTETPLRSLYYKMLNQPFTAPTVRPEIKYLWKNGYVHAIGIIMMIAIAIRAPSFGMLLMYSTIVAPSAGLFAIISIFLCT